MKNIFTALSKFQAECGPALLDETNPHFRSKFASIASLHDTIQPLLAKHGLTVLQFPIACEDRAGVRTIIGHVSGESLEQDFSIPMGAKQDPQKAVAAVSYARRASLSGALGLVTAESIDQDGEDLVGRGRQPQTLPQQKEDTPRDRLWKLATARTLALGLKFNKENVTRICVESLAQMGIGKADEVKAEDWQKLTNIVEQWQEAA